MKNRAFNIVIDPNFNHSFLAKRCKDPNLFVPLHFHQNYEIMAILNGEGTRFVGNNISSFSSGDLVMLGKELPHVWLNNKEYYENRKDLFSEIIVANFDNTIKGFEFIQLPEFDNVRELLKKANRGIKFYGKTQIVAFEILKQMVDKKGVGRFIKLIELLDVLSESNEFELIAGESYRSKSKSNNNDQDRISKVYEFILYHYSEDINEESVAKHIGMNTSSFSRYFKSKTYKNFSVFLNEVRISQASKMMLEDNKTISEIAYLCGYTSISNFNRQFKRFNKQTPLEYKKSYQNNIIK